VFDADESLLAQGWLPLGTTGPGVIYIKPLGDDSPDDMVITDANLLALEEEEARKHNFFPTPQPLADACVTAIPIEPRTVLDLGAGGGNWGLALHKHTEYMLECGLWTRRPYVTGIEIRDVQRDQYPNLAYYNEWLQADALNVCAHRVGRKNRAPAPANMIPAPDVVMMNPPYSVVPGIGNRAEAFIRQGVRLVRHGGYVLALLRMAVLAGQERYKSLWQPHDPNDKRPIGYRINDPKAFKNPLGLRMVFVLPRRPVFVQAGSDPRTEYALFLFQKGYKGRPELDFLPW